MVSVVEKRAGVGGRGLGTRGHLASKNLGDDLEPTISLKRAV